MIKKRQLVLYLAPALLMAIIFFAVPIVYVIYVGFYSWDGLSPKVWVGIQNYIAVFQDKTFITAFKNTIFWIIGAVCIHVPLGMFLALLLNKKPKRWKIYRVLYFIPNVISTTAIAFLWYFIYHPTVGLLNSFLKKIGLESFIHKWLGSLDTALICSMIPFLLYVGLTMIIFQTQLATIDTELYEAADVDGASGLQKDLKISIPMLKPAIITNVLLNVAFCLRNFEYPYLMTSGGPANQTMNLSLYIYKEMTSANKYGISMVSSLVAIILGLIVMLFVRTMEKER